MTALPLDFASQIRMTGRSQLWIVEPDKADVCTPKKQIVKPHAKWPQESGTLAKTTLGNAKSVLELREWDFYTALIKTELAYPLPGEALADRSYGAYLQHHALLRWNSGNLRLAQSGVFSRKDSVRTALSGRFGEALMYLYMVQSGYPYWDHLPSLAERLMEKHEYSRDDKLRIARVLSRPTRSNGKRVPEPDYAFESVSQEVALAEAKGAFVNPEDSPNTAKKGLSKGLEQLKLWQSHISPSPAFCFAIGAYLREEHDRHPDPSLLAVVDPEKDDEGLRTLEFPDDWVRRGNYAAWMRGMGLSRSADLLAYGRNLELPAPTVHNRRNCWTFIRHHSDSLRDVATLRVYCRFSAPFLSRFFPLVRHTCSGD